MKRIIIVLGMVFVFGGTAVAGLINVTVVTDKPVYQLGEYVTVSVSAYNSMLEPYTFHFPTTLQATYDMVTEDPVYRTFVWHEGKTFEPIYSEITLGPGESYTWDLVHDQDEMAIFPLDIGTYSVMGAVGTTLWSGNPTEFEVIPEPATFLLFAVGMILAKANKTKQ